MSTLKDLRDIRLDKLSKLKALGVDPYPARSSKNVVNLDVTEKYKKFDGKAVTVAGRVMSIRDHSNLYFVDIKDSSGKLQLYVKSANFEDADYSNSELAFGDIHLLDVGDFLEAVGKVTKTKRGEISVEVSKLRILSKSLRPSPNTWDGLKDKETRLRRRYLDTNINEDVYQRFLRRSRFWEVHREFLKERGFVEINIPVLEAVPGGADAKPFVTHMDAIDQDFYLRISQELYLKRLIGGGYDKVYEIGPRFRNEGLSDEHLPEHFAMELYWAYASWEEGMELVKDLYSCILEKVYDGKQKFSIRGHDVDFSKGWEMIDFSEIMNKEYGIDVNDTTIKEVAKLLGGTAPENITRGVDALWKKAREKISGPAFLINHPKYLSPLAKSKADNPNIVERFQPIIAGSELGNAWSEINDPQDQLARFREQQALREAGDEEAQWLDIDYVEMLEYGMPPTFGFGHSERVFWFLEGVSAREGVPFPQLRVELDENTKEIYGL
jgi:lysyl-tRNA synthetase class 2